MPKLTFDPTATEFILSGLGLDTDDDGYVVDAESGDRIVSPGGHEIPKDEFGGVAEVDGEDWYIHASFTSMVDVVEAQRTD